MTVEPIDNQMDDTAYVKPTYFQTIAALITSPRMFFSGLPQHTGYKQALVFLSMSGLFWASLRYTYFSDHSLFQAFTLAANAMGMPCILAAFTFMIMGLFFGRLASYKQITIIYAYATGVTMLISWLPTLEIFTEPWRFFLVAVGLVRWCAFRWIQAITAVVLGVVIMLVMLASMSPVLVYLRQYLV
ncbi:MAG: hypothetical protein CSA21_02010 [Deltaproteobacteria bacterium]|nr:MAG: hypothetical protein CSA21_02010 [Deltaproteobacteria bacterium]